MEELAVLARQAVEKYRMLDGVSRAAVAYSGGADSSALLDFMSGECRARGIELEAIHINHNIRGGEALRDAEFCAAECARLGVRLNLVSADVPARAREWGCGLEEAGRRVRYAEFERISRERGIDRVATAHHASDNLETVIFNLARGSGSRGISGIPPVRGSVIRPFITAPRRVIDEYISSRKISYTEDSTNKSDEYSRNYIRLNIVPALEKLNSSAAQAVTRMCSLVRADDEYLCGEAAQYAAAPASVLAQLPQPLLTRALAAALPADTAPGGINLSLAAQAVRRCRDTRVSVGHGTALYIRGDRVYFAPDLRREPEEQGDFRAVLAFGETLCTASGTAVYYGSDRAELGRLKNIYKKSIYTDIGFDKIEGNICVRTRQPGDRMMTRGMHRTAKNLFAGCGITGEARRSLPCFADGAGLLWIPGVALRDGASGTDAFLAYFEEKDTEQ